MASSEGTTIIIYLGETLDAEFPVVDKNGASYDLTGGAATFTYWQGSGAAVNVTCSIATTTVTASQAHAITRLLSLGEYDYQLFCRNSSNQMVMTVEGKMEVRYSKNPDAVAPA